jgi:NAD-dependent histone deacetylase SIR2
MGQESSHELVDEGAPARTLKDRTISSVAEHIKSGKAKRVVVLTGAGISTSAGIPDFRSPDTGLYSNLARLDLPYPEAVFDISFFRQNPQPFYMLAQELYPGKYKPTVSHAFISLLSKKGLLHMLFTQNIDCLERAAGVSSEKVIEAHGSFASQRCIECKTEYPDELMKEFIKLGDIPHCAECEGLVKPDITFFGEALPERFHSNTHVPAQADLMIIIGTSLSVHPFASLPDFALEGTPRVLLNMERVGSLGSRPDDVLLLGDCDGQVRRLADELGWRDELEALYKEVGGPAALKEPATHRTKHEVLEEEIEKLTTEVDRALKLSNGHKSWLEKHLAEKSATEEPVEAVSQTNNENEQGEEIEAKPITLGSKESSSGLRAETDTANECTKTIEAAVELGLQNGLEEPSAPKETESSASTSNIHVQVIESTVVISLTDPETNPAHPKTPSSESTT